MNALIRYYNIFFILCKCRTFLLVGRMEKKQHMIRNKGFRQWHCIYSTSEKYSLKGHLKVRRLFLQCMIWLLAHPLSPLSSAGYLSFSAFLCVAGRAYWREVGTGVSEEPNHTTARKRQVLHRPFNTLCSVKGTSMGCRTRIRNWSFLAAAQPADPIAKPHPTLC